MKLIRYTNVEGLTVDITVKRPFLLQKLEGFGPVQNMIETSELYGADGEAYLDSKLVVRDMVIQGEILADSTEQLAEYRQILIRVFNPKVSGSLHYIEHKNHYVIDVEVEFGPDFNMEKSSITQKFQLILKALDPYWTDQSEIDAEIPLAGKKNMFSFPLNITDDFEFAQLIAGDTVEIVNNGHVKTGAVFTIQINGEVINPRIYNVVTQEYFKIRGTFLPKTTLRISTVRGNKRVEQNDGDDEWYNIMMKREVGSTFLQLDKGINYLQLQAEKGIEHTVSSIRFEPKLLGV